jgi:hypothetical protein
MKLARVKKSRSTRTGFAAKLAASLATGLTATLAISSIAQPVAAATASTVSSKGAKGQVFTASAARNLADGQKVTLTGRGYNTKLGIYVTYCVMPPKGSKPSECGPFDITGKNNSSFWISSNPPVYALPLVTPFGKGGTFKVSMAATRKIGDQDCAIVRCAFTTRADHLSGDNRSADVFIPVTFRK